MSYSSQGGRPEQRPKASTPQGATDTTRGREILKHRMVDKHGAHTHPVL